MSRAYSITDVARKKYKLLDWGEDWQTAFENPETTGIWCIWGNSGNGKTSFVMQLIKELARSRKVHFHSKEEGIKLTMQRHIERHGLEEVKRNVTIADESTEELVKRCENRKSAKVVVVDSVQASRMNMATFHKLVEANPDKLFIFISQAEGKNPKGNTADNIKYLADLKIWVEGYRAISQGRFNPGGVYTIWDEGANEYWGAIEAIGNVSTSLNDRLK